MAMRAAALATMLGASYPVGPVVRGSYLDPAVIKPPETLFIDSTRNRHPQVHRSNHRTPPDGLHLPAETMTRRRVLIRALSLRDRSCRDLPRAVASDARNRTGPGSFDGKANRTASLRPQSSCTHARVGFDIGSIAASSVPNAPETRDGLLTRAQIGEYRGCLLVR